MARKIDLKECVLVTSQHPTAREIKALAVLADEAGKRSGLTWDAQPPGKSTSKVTIYAGLASSLGKLGPRTEPAAASAGNSPETYAIHTGRDSGGDWITIAGSDERGVLFGAGQLLRSIDFAHQAAILDTSRLPRKSSPHYRLRGHQLGYRPKTNSYDAWTVEVWDQYIRELAIFGANAIELIPPRSDDEADSPLFPLPPGQMMVEMSRIADSYGLDVWIWYPAMDKDYSDPQTISGALEEWAGIFRMLPRVDAVFVPGGDPGHTRPKELLNLLQKQKAGLRKYHPMGQMWVSPQSFTAEWLDEFLSIAAMAETKGWLDGVVYGPQCRLPLAELRRRLPAQYPIRFYPDITHSLGCQFPVPDWDVAYALTEGRETINPRPMSQAGILRNFLPQTIGFITYSEGCNDDANKFLWSALGWDPQRSVSDVLRDYSHYFAGSEQAEGLSQGLMRLEEDWRGPLATNTSVAVTIAQFQDMERIAAPPLLGNWRFQQALYRAYYDAYLQSRLALETAAVERALDVLRRVNGAGWMPAPLEIGGPPSSGPPNGADPRLLLDEAAGMLKQSLLQSAAGSLRDRVLELGEALFQSIRMQLDVTRYRAEAVVRGANLETLDYPVSDGPWLLARIAEIMPEADRGRQLAAIRALLRRTDPGPGGFYDELGNSANRPHLLMGEGVERDPEFRATPLTGFSYPDRLGNQAPLAWKRWAESLYDAPLRMRYTGLDEMTQYRLRIVYSGDQPARKIRLVANERFEIHPYVLRAWPPAPQEFNIPAAATSGGELNLAWAREPGLGGNGRGCQVSEVWLMMMASG
ncbi:MAG: hypothetical protein WA510_18500 [Acidobacteriaceae bacterium]